MTRRSKPYIVELSARPFKLSASEWDELIVGGWIERSGYKTARPRRGVVALVCGGDLFVMPFAPMSCVTARWFLIWLFQVSVISAAYVGETVNQRQERVLFERERDRQNEALIWCSRRGKKGKNEFRWMTPEQKAEVMRLKPLAEAA